MWLYFKNNNNYYYAVPDAPLISGIPTYSQQNKSLLRITISFTEMVLLTIQWTIIRPCKIVLLLVSHPRLPLFQPTASAFIIALQCQPRLFLVDYLAKRGWFQEVTPSKRHNEQ